MTFQPGGALGAIVVNAAFAFAGYRARAVSISGAVSGALIGVVVYLALSPAAWVFLFATFLAASAASRLGLAEKMRLGIAEARGGRRGAGSAVANCGVAALAAAAAATTPFAVESRLVFVAALTAGGSDTVASEIGKAWGHAAFLITSLRRVDAGTPGGMSVEGTVAGFVAAVGLAALAAALGLVTRSTVVPVVVGATIGALVESILGATLERRGILNNDQLNFINTAIAAGAALAIA